jgi:hypothetical protein
MGKRRMSQKHVDNNAETYLVCRRCGMREKIDNYNPFDKIPLDADVCETCFMELAERE